MQKKKKIKKKRKKIAWGKDKVSLNDDVKFLDHGQRTWTQFESIFAAVIVMTPMTIMVSKGTIDWKYEAVE